MDKTKRGRKLVRVKRHARAIRSKKQPSEGYLTSEEFARKMEQRQIKIQKDMEQAVRNILTSSKKSFKKWR
jgi:hypothetical protein